MARKHRIEVTEEERDAYRLEWLNARRYDFNVPPLDEYIRRKKRDGASERDR